MLKDSPKKSPHPMCNICGHAHQGLAHAFPGGKVKPAAEGKNPFGAEVVMKSKVPMKMKFTNSAAKPSKKPVVAGSNLAGRGVAKAAAGLGARAPVAKNAGGKANTVAQQVEPRQHKPAKKPKPKRIPQGKIVDAVARLEELKAKRAEKQRRYRANVKARASVALGEKGK